MNKEKSIYVKLNETEYKIFSKEHTRFKNNQIEKTGSYNIRKDVKLLPSESLVRVTLTGSEPIMSEYKSQSDFKFIVVHNFSFD